MRQDLNKKYLENGSFYIFDKKNFLKINVGYLEKLVSI